MTDSTTPQDDAAMSPASDGSVARRELRVPDWKGNPVDLWIDADGDLGLMDEKLQFSIVIHKKAIPKIAAWLGIPALTDAEREAIEAGAIAVDRLDEEMDGFSSNASRTLRAMLQRLK